MNVFSSPFGPTSANTAHAGGTRKLIPILYTQCPKRTKNHRWHQNVDFFQLKLKIFVEKHWVIKYRNPELESMQTLKVKLNNVNNHPKHFYPCCYKAMELHNCTGKNPDWWAILTNSINSKELTEQHRKRSQCESSRAAFKRPPLINCNDLEKSIAIIFVLNSMPLIALRRVINKTVHRPKLFSFAVALI